MPTGIDDTAAQVQPDQGFNPQASRIGSYLFQNRPAQPQPTAAPQPAPQPTPDTPPPGYIKYGNQYHPGYIDPGTFTQIENLTKDKAIEHRAYVYPDLDSATKQTGGAWKTTFLNPVSGQWYGDTVDANGNNFIDPRLVDRGRTPVDKASHAASWGPREIIDTEHSDQFPSGHRTAEFNRATGEWRAPTGSKTPLPEEMQEWTSGTDRAFFDYKQGFKNASQDFTSVNSLNRWKGAEQNKIDTDAGRPNPANPGTPLWDPNEIAKRRAALEKSYSDQYQSIQQHFQPKVKQGPVSINGSADSVGNPFGITDPKQGVFKHYGDPVEGLRDGYDTIGRYLSPQGVLNVNEDSTLLDMMRQWAPKNDPRGKNDPDTYAATLAKAMGLPNGVSTRIGDLRDRQADLAKAIVSVETPSKAKQYAAALDDIARGTSSSVTAPPPGAGRSAPPANPFRIEGPAGLTGHVFGAK